MLVMMSMVTYRMDVGVIGKVPRDIKFTFFTDLGVI
jgi:hypothetical protein